MSHNFESSHQHDAIYEQYGPFYSGLLDEVLGFIRAVATRQLSESEIRVKVMARFEEILLANVPACHEPVARYMARVSAEQKAIAENSAAYHERQQKEKLVEAQLQRKTIEAADRARQAAKEEEDRKAREHREQFDREQRGRQQEADRKEADAAAELERRLQAVDGGQQ